MFWKQALSKQIIATIAIIIFSNIFGVDKAIGIAFIFFILLLIEIDSIKKSLEDKQYEEVLTLKITPDRVARHEMIIQLASIKGMKKISDLEKLSKKDKDRWNEFLKELLKKLYFTLTFLSSKKEIFVVPKGDPEFHSYIAPIGQLDHSNDIINVDLGKTTDGHTISFIVKRRLIDDLFGIKFTHLLTGYLKEGRGIGKENKIKILFNLPEALINPSLLKRGKEKSEIVEKRILKKYKLKKDDWYPDPFPDDLGETEVFYGFGYRHEDFDFRYFYT